MTRPTLDDMFMQIAIVLSKRGTCAKKQVGCVITDEQGHILSTGYNGQPHGHKHCTKAEPCEAYIDPAKSCYAIHAEQNALIRCIDIHKAYTIYITDVPCQKCRLLLYNTNIKRIVTA